MPILKGGNSMTRFQRSESLLEDSVSRSIPDRADIAQLYRGLRDRSPFYGDYDGLFCTFGSARKKLLFFSFGVRNLDGKRSCESI